MGLLRRLRRFGTVDDGGPALEFGLLLPFLVVLLLGGIEAGRLLVLGQKIERVAGTLADLVSQAEALTAAEVDALLVAAKHIASPFQFEDAGAVIVSSVGLDGRGRPVVNWQRKGGGQLAVSSSVGRPGRRATLPAGFSIRSGETVIVAESYYDFHPLVFGQVFPPRIVQHLALFRPRLGALETLD
ncbi:MAG: pilus assembly protein [Rhodospirillales bacterium]|nr:pilus assembly protein [Rhodospirillales bacterium]